MKKKLLSIVIVAVFLTSLISVMPNTALSSTMSGSTARPILELNRDNEGIDGTPNFEGMRVEGAQPDSGNPWDVIVLDDYYGGFYIQTFECVASGTHANIWIGLSTDVWGKGKKGYRDYYDPKGPGFDDDEWHFMYPWTKDGYEFWPGYHDVIYGKNITYVLDQFDNNIHDTDVEFFGDYQYRPGPLDDGKIQILIFNIRDGMFYDPWSYTSFIEGYFWYFASSINNANIIHIDTYQWYRRLGPNPQPDPRGYDPRPYEYEGTFAHEFQHLIHRDVDNDELSWVNEGCSTLAEYICGYGFPSSHIYYYFAYFWDTSLVIWRNYLENYGVVFLWTFYMYEHYGGQPLIWDIVHEQANGIEGYNNVLQAHGIHKTFDEIFQDWAIAIYLDDTSFANGIYGFYDLDIPSADTYWYSLQYFIWYWEAAYPSLFDTQVTEYPNVGYNYPYGSSIPYVVNYVEFYDGAPELKVYFDGDDYCGVPAHSGMYEWHSDGTAWSWFRSSQTFDLTGQTTATLKFWTYYEIEEDWDYGYVEVHDLDTGEWYTLPGLTTISTIPNPQDNPYCPDDVEPTAYLAAGRWNAFTGYSPGYYQEVMDLSPFAGHTIDLCFTYWTDGYTLELGWYVDDIEIPEIGFFDDVESGPNGWNVNAGWYITTGIMLNDFEVNFIETMHLVNDEGEEVTLHHISPMKLNDETEEGQELLTVIETEDVTSGPAVMVAANQPGYEHTFGTFYYFIADIQPFLS